MAFLSTSSVGNYSPRLSVRGGVYYSRESIIPDSGHYNVIEAGASYDVNSFFSLRSNSRVNGRYNLNNFEQGYFNFENWDNNICYSIDSTKSGIQNNLGLDSKPYLVNFWGRGDTLVGRTAVYNYGQSSADPQPNISTALVMSGIDGGPYDDMKIYIGTIPSGDITIYGRVGNVNNNYYNSDRILSLSTIPVIVDPESFETSYTFPTTGANNSSTGTFDWQSPGSITADDSVTASVPVTTLGISRYLLGTGYGFSLSGYTIDSITAEIEYSVDGFSTQNENQVRLFLGGSPIGNNKSTGTNITNGTRTYIWNSSDLGGLTGDDVSNSTFGVGLAVDIVSGMMNQLLVDYIKVKIAYSTAPIESSDQPQANLTLLNRFDGDEKRLNWSYEAYDNIRYVDLPGFSFSNKFANFMFTYSSGNGYGNFYVGYDNEPLTLVNRVYLGDITTVFNGVTTFYEDSWDITTNNNNNPKIITDFGISSRAWNATQIAEFDHHRLNSAYFLTEDPASTFAYPSGSDTNYLQFHFPVGSSGTLGSFSSGNPTYIQHYVPLKSGSISNQLYQMDRSQFNSTALTLNMWVENTGSNQSGNLGAIIEFGERNLVFDKMYLYPNHYWSGYPIQIPSGIQQVRMSGIVLDANSNPADLEDIPLSEVNDSALFLGAWYNNVGRNYNGDIRVYSARVLVDSWLTPLSSSNSTTLVVSGKEFGYNSIPLYLQQNGVAETVPLYIQGKDSSNTSCTLYIAGAFGFGTIPLYVCGTESINSGIPLYIAGSKETASMVLYTYSAPYAQQSGNFPLSVWGTNNSGMFSYTTLFIGENAPSGNKDGSMNLFVNGPISAQSMSSMNLYINSAAPIEHGNTTLFVENNYSDLTSSIPLYISTPSGVQGTGNGSMNLFINREYESVAGGTSLFVGGPSQFSGNTTLYVNGGTPYFSSIPLYVNGIGVANAGTFKLYTNGY